MKVREFQETLENRSQILKKIFQFKDKLGLIRDQERAGHCHTCGHGLVYVSESLPQMNLLSERILCPKCGSKSAPLPRDMN